MTQVEITTIENILLGFTVCFLVLYIFSSLVQSKPHWFMSKRLMKVRKMQGQYEKLLQARKDQLHHYFWSESNKEWSKMKKMEKDILKLDKQLEQIRVQYQLVRKGLPIPLKMF